MLRKYLIGLCFLGSLAFCACDDSDDDIDNGNQVNPIPEGSIRITGNIVEPTTKSMNKTATERSMVLVYTEKFTVENFSDGLEHESAEIAEDGSFNIDITEGKEFLMFLMENDKAVGLVGINTTDGQYWENINSGYLKGLVALGDIPSSSDNGLLVAEKTLDDITVVDDKSDLIKNISRVDDHVRTYMNFVNSGFKHWVTPGFCFFGNLQENEFITSINYAGYQLYVCGVELSPNMVLFPPSQVSKGNGTSFDPNTSISCDFSTDDEFSLHGFVSGEVSDDLLQGNIPAGEWLLKSSSDVLVGKHHLNSVTPVVAEKILVPVPVIKINTSEENSVSNIEVKWQYNDNGVMKDIDAALLEDRILNLHVEFMDTNNEEAREEMYFEVNATTVTPEQAWAMSQGIEGENYVGRVVVGYLIDGVFYMFKYDRVG